MKFTYKWNLSDLDKVPKNGYKVFSCFAGGGGSSQGYKMAGYDVVGCNEIDPRQMEIYVHNLKPKYAFLEDIRKFRTRDDLPKELYELDILDASFPCSLFSSANLKADEKKGKEVKFREGQVSQTLDDLAFETINLVDKIKPKICIFENVKGLLHEKNKWYVEQIYKQFDNIGYKICHHLINCADLGVPQKRERVFFFAVRNDIKVPTSDIFGCEPLLDLDIKERWIPFKEIYTPGFNDNPLPKGFIELWNIKKDTDVDFVNANKIKNSNNKRSGFNMVFCFDDKVCLTLTPRDNIVLHSEPRFLNNIEQLKCNSWSQDYNFLGQKQIYVLGMSVPPLAMYRISKEIQTQWLDKL